MSLREYAEPALASAEGYGNITDLLERRVAEAPEAVAFDVRHPDAAPGAAWEPVTVGAFHTRVQALAKGLIGLGVRPGDHVAVCAATRYEWTLVDLACLYAGAVVVPMFDTAPATQMAAIADAVDVRAAVAGTAELAATLAEVLDGRDGTLGVWTMDPGPAGPGTGAHPAARGDLAALAVAGVSVTHAALEAARTARGLDDVATIVFTSGTTSTPKGARILHRSFVHQVLNVAEAYSSFLRPDGATVLFLPLAHVLSRGVQMICLHRGMRLAHVADPKQAVASLRELHPTFLMVVPRVLEKILEAATANAEKARLTRVWHDAVVLATEAGARSLGEEPPAPGPARRARLALYDRLFFRRLRTLLGGRIETLLCGAAPLDPQLVRFFTGAGVPVIEGYGLTETTAPACGNRVGDVVPGSVGRPVPGMAVRIAEDGEVLVSGPGVFAGYVDPEEDETSVDGPWLRTGDLGELDDDGRLRLTGRSRDVVVTSGGKTINPAAWERQVELHPAIGHAVVLGDGLAHPTAMILLDPDALPAWVKKVAPAAELPAAAGRLREVTEARIRESVAAAVEAANERVPAAERLRSFTVLLPDAESLRPLLTPTQKLKRSVLAEKIAHLLPKR